MAKEFAQDIADVQSIRAVPTILDVVCRTTGMRFAAVARVTEDRWIACSVRDDIAFGLAPGGELDVTTTLCHEIRQSGEAVIIDHVAEDTIYAKHHTPAIYGLQSYISIPIRLTDGSFFGTLCAIDPEPRRLNTPETIAMFEMFAEIIGFHLSSIDRIQVAEASLLDERKTAALREHFVAVLGHDMRNPLAAIDSGMNLLLRTPLNEKAVRIVHMIRGSIDRAAKLIDNVLDFTRGRLGPGLTLHYNDDAPLETVLQQVIAELQVTAPDRRIDIAIALTEPIKCDCQRIGQLLSNLLGNALTYGPIDRPIRVGAVTQHGQFELSVTNEGEPIPATLLPSIFEPFTRGAQPGREGLGLGLYIAHEIAKAHGGTLTVRSSEAETCFTFRMPLGAG